MSIFFCYNNKFYEEGELVIEANNRSFRYGDGLFETMKMIGGKIVLKQFHFERLFFGLKLLQFQIPPNFDGAFLEEKIKLLCIKNQHSKCVRVRLTVFRGNGGLYDAKDNRPNYLVEAWSIENKLELNANGLLTDIYTDAKKSCDKFSNLKSNNFLPYVMGALYAKQNKLNDSILLNVNERVCDSTIANIFLIKDKIIYTPSLSEGCIAGTVRRWIIENLSNGFKIIEKEISVDELLTAEEVFLTNSIFDIRWVKQIGNTNYKCDLIKKIYQEFIQNMYR